MAGGFKKKKYIKVKASKRQAPSVPDGMWVKCNHCGEVIYKEDFHKTHRICTACQKHFRLDSKTRLKMVLDEGTFEAIDTDLQTRNVLGFPGYDQKIEGLQEKTGLQEGVVTGTGVMEGVKVAIGVMDSRFMMGSMGAVVGEKITRLIELATKEGLPLILFTASGGARMQEGIISLMQMAKTSAALSRFSDSGGLYITVLTDPTSGGVTASFAMLGDIILAEPGTFIGFAGPRVIKQTIKKELPDGFQKAEFLKEHGFVDKIVTRDKMKQMLHKLLVLHGYTGEVMK